jgi:predicted XRE-type DNA-binding protein
MPDLSTNKGQQDVKPFLENVELIIVDNIATLCRRGNENDTESWKPVQEWALKMRASGKAVLFIHHAGKKGAQRGASAHEDTLSAVLRLSRPENYSPSQGAVFEIHFEKSRGLFGDDIKPYKASLTTENKKQLWITDDLPPDISTIVIQKLNEGLKQSEIAKELHIHKSNVSRYVKKAKQEGLLKLPSFAS